MLLAIAGLAFCSACTPARSTLRPPYDVGGEELDEARIQVLAIERCQATGASVPPHPFTTDGCSLWPEGNWSACCVEHDLAYWCGGEPTERKKVDAALRSCVLSRGHPAHARVMLIGVRLGGHRLWPFPWRWGYGHDWPYAEARK